MALSCQKDLQVGVGGDIGPWIQSSGTWQAHLKPFVIGALTLIGVACSYTSDIEEPVPELEGMRVAASQSLEIHSSDNGVASVKIKEPKIAFTTVSFNTQDAKNSFIVIARLAGNPLDPDKAVKGDVYQYIQLNSNGKNSANFEEATLEFEVANNWLVTVEREPYAVRLFRYSEKWHALPTEIIGRTNGSVTYEAKSPGFSVFAIATIDPRDVEIENLTIKPTVRPTVRPSPVILKRQTPTPISTGSSSTTPVTVTARLTAHPSTTPTPTPTKTPGEQVISFPRPIPTKTPEPHTIPTQSPTPTIVPMFESTQTPLITPTPSATFTHTPTHLPSNRPTLIPAPTSTTVPPTPTPTPTPTSTPTPTYTPPTPTQLPTSTPTPIGKTGPPWTPSPTPTPIPSPTPTPTPTPDTRYGVVAHSESGYFLKQLGVNWYLNFNARSNRIPSGTNKLLFVRNIPLDSVVWTSGQAEAINSLTPSEISSLGFPTPSQIQKLVEDAPRGSYWYLYGEANKHHSITGDRFAPVLHYLITNIRTHDATAKIVGTSILNWDYTCLGCGGVFQCEGIPGSLTGYQCGKDWLKKLISSYEELYGSKPPVDAWGIDAYPIDWISTPNNDPDQAAWYQADGMSLRHSEIVKQQFEKMRSYLDSVPEYSETPIWITEIALHVGYDSWDWRHNETEQPCTDGELWAGQCKPGPVGTYHWNLMSDYFASLLDWLEGNANNLNIERWFFFITWADIVSGLEGGYLGPIFFDSPQLDAPLNCLGELYRAYALGLAKVKCDANGATISNDG